MQKSFKDVMDEIKKCQNIVDTPITDDNRLKGFQLGRKERAIDDLEGLGSDLIKSIWHWGLFIFVNGKDAKKFKGIAHEEVDAMMFQTSKLVTDIVNNLEPEIYVGKNMSSHILDILAGELEDKANKMEIVSFPMLKYDKTISPDQIIDKSHFINIVKGIFLKQLGGEMFVLYAAQQLSLKVFKTGFESKYLPIIMFDRDAEFNIKVVKEANKVARYPFFVTAGQSNKEADKLADEKVKEVNKDNVMKALASIRKKI